MELGLFTAAFPDTELTEVADWASAHGFSRLEAACWPRGEGAARRYAGVSHIDVTTLDEVRGRELVEDLAGRGVRLSALGFYPNPMHPDPDVRADVAEHLRALIRGAAVTGVNLVTTFAGGDQTRTPDQNLVTFAEIFPPLVRYAADHGVRIAIENCPMIFSHDEWPAGHNIAYSPRIWDAMFDAVDGDPTLGINLDPSHLVWQMIDIERVVRDYGSRIYHVHAKDLQIDREGLYRNGIMSAGIGWQVPRLPGHGDVDWQRFVAALYRAGYDEALIVEHEDRAFEGTDELIKRGFLLARGTLAPLMG